MILVTLLASTGNIAGADPAAPAIAPNPVHVIVFGYQQSNGEMFFQIHVDELAPADQPPLVKSGDRLKFGPYQIGAFHEAQNPVVPPLGGRPVPVNLSTLEIINLTTGAKIALPFRRLMKL